VSNYFLGKKTTWRVVGSKKKKDRRTESRMLFEDGEFRAYRMVD
jgi:hypothetical protein